MPKDVLIRVPNNLVKPWQEIRQAIEVRLSEDLRIPVEQVTTAAVFQEVVQILGEYIFVARYPRPGDAHKRAMVVNAKHEELVAATAKVRELENTLDGEVRTLKGQVADLQAQLRDLAD